MHGFVGRERELSALDRVVRRVTRGGRAGRPGRAVLVRGRRRVGKSRLIEEFIDRSGLPHLYFTASALTSTADDLAMFVEAGRRSSLPGASVFDGQAPRSWDAALTLLASAVPQDVPSVVVLDELSYLIRNDAGLEGTLQKIYDRELSRRPVLLIGIGSDLSMMESLDSYGRPFHQRATEMVIEPLTPGDVSAMLRLPAGDALDAHLVSGGLPLVLDEWEPGWTVRQYLGEAVRDPTSALIVSGERALTAEFPTESQARRVLGAIGAGERSFSLIGRAAGGLPQGSLTRALEVLTAKRVVAAATPLSTRPVTGEALHGRRPAPAVLVAVPRPSSPGDRARPRGSHTAAHREVLDDVARPRDRTGGARGVAPDAGAAPLRDGGCGGVLDTVERPGGRPHRRGPGTRGSVDHPGGIDQVARDATLRRRGPGAARPPPRPGARCRGRHAPDRRVAHRRFPSRHRDHHARRHRRRLVTRRRRPDHSGG